MDFGCVHGRATYNPRGFGMNKTAPHEGESTFRTLFEKSPDAIGVSREGVHIFVNPAYVQLFGYDSVVDLAGKSVFDVIAPSSRSEVAERIARRSRGGEAQSRYEARGLRRDG